MFRIGGHVTAAGVPVAGATVTLVQLGLVAQTDEGGRYQLGSMAAGTYAVRAEKNASTRTTSVVVPRKPGGDYDIQI
jgi:DNA-binding IclR family transcriptional regulator